MAIPSQQIGWSQRAKLLWQISKQLETLTKVAYKGSDTTTTTTTTTTTSTTTTGVPLYYIGQLALGGMISYLLQPGDIGYNPLVQKGIVAQLTDASTSANWGCTAPIGEFSASRYSILGGFDNIEEIVYDGCTAPGGFQSILNSEGGYSWTVPTVDDLQTLYSNIGPGAPVPLTNAANFSDATYWTSSHQYSGDPTIYGELQSFVTGEQSSDEASVNYHVRLVRYF